MQVIMFSAELPSEMKQLLTDVTPNFDENLKRVSGHILGALPENNRFNLGF